MARAPARSGAAVTGGTRSGWRRRLLAYLRGVWDELRKVVWPTRSELWRMTWVVVATVVVFGLLIGGADALFTQMATPLYNSSPSNSTTPATTIPTAPPSASAGASASASASASSSPGASPSASAGASPSPTP